jgi:hypothetical protein
MLDTKSYKHTLGIRNIYCVFTATMVTGTLLSVTSTRVLSVFLLVMNETVNVLCEVQAKSEETFQRPPHNIAKQDGSIERTMFYRRIKKGPMEEPRCLTAAMLPLHCARWNFEHTHGRRMLE